MNLQKSISSQAESISAWKAVFDWFSMVEALTRILQSPASRSAHLSKMAHLPSRPRSIQDCWESTAALHAASISPLPARWTFARM